MAWPSVPVFDGVVEKVNNRSTIDRVPYTVSEYKITVVFYDRCGDETRQYSVSSTVTHQIVCSSTLRLKTTRHVGGH